MGHPIPCRTALFLTEGLEESALELSTSDEKELATLQARTEEDPGITVDFSAH